MLQSKLYIKTSKQAPADSDSANAELLSKGGFIHKEMAGVYSMLPLGLRVLSKIQNIIREEMNALGAQEVRMPVLSSLDSWKKTKREAMDVLFHLKGANDADLVLNPTHEELITPIMQQHIFSYKDLPAAVYQIQDKFRNEPRAKSGILRGREFNMKDLYSFHASQEDLDVYYETVKESYHTIYQRLGIGESTILAFAAGGDFSKYSHEFQTLCDIGEDTLYVCTTCHVGVNKEIYHEQKDCPQCGNTKLTEKNAIEVGNIFKLGTRFSKAIGLTYSDDTGKKQPVIMASYGIGPTRIMGTLVEIFHDEAGIIWPASVAPFYVHFVCLDADDIAVKKKADAIYKKLQKSKLDVLYDDRQDMNTGSKLKDADLIGIPWRMIVSKRTMNNVEIQQRGSTKADTLSLAKSLDKLK